MNIPQSPDFSSLFRRTLPALIIFCAAFASSPAFAATPQTVLASSASSQIRLLGRSLQVGTSVTFDWSNSGFEFEADCEGQVSASITQKRGFCSLGYFQVTVDGVTGNRVAFDMGTNLVGTQTFILASGLTKGRHRFKVVKINEAQYTKMALESVTFTGTLLTAPSAPAVKMEVLGDSISCAEGALGWAPTVAQTDSQDASRSYAGLTAAALGADLNVVAASSWGLYRGRTPTPTQSVIPAIYGLASYFRDNSTTWDFNRYQPDIVVVNLGTNDFEGRGTNPFTDDEYKTALKNFHTVIRSKYPSAQIFWVSGMMVKSADALTSAAVTELRTSDLKVNYVKLPQNNGGGNGHPDLTGHQQAATVLTAKIREVMPNLPGGNGTQVLSKVAVSPVSTSINAGTTQQFTAAGTDTTGSPLALTNVSWSVSGGGTIDSNGLFTAGAGPGGPFVVAATSSGISGTANVTVTGGDPSAVLSSVTVTPANQAITAGGTLQFTAVGRNSKGVVLSPQPPFNWSANGGGTINASGLFTSSAGSIGSFTVTAANGGISGTASVQVNAPAPVLSSLVISPASSRIAANGTQKFTVKAKDQFGADFSPQPAFTWTVSGGGTIDANGLFTAGSTAGGPFLVTAAGGGKTATAGIYVSTPLVLFDDAPLNGCSLSGTGNALVTSPVRSGTKAFGATGGSFLQFGLSTANLLVPVGKTTLRMFVYVQSPATSVNAFIVQLGNPTYLTKQFTHTSNPSYWTVDGISTHTDMSLSPNTWHEITLDLAGVFGSTLVPGTTTLNSVTVMFTGASESVYVDDVTLTQPSPLLNAITISPASASVPAAGTQQYLAAGTDQNGIDFNPMPSLAWTVSGGGTIDSTGLFTAGNASGGPFTVAAKVAALSANASVTVATPGSPTITSIALSPGSATLQSGASQQFTAIAKDQYGSSLSPQPLLTWSVTGGGTISTSGLFAGGVAAGGPFTVTAFSGGIGGTSSLLIQDLPYAAWKVSQFGANASDPAVSGDTVINNSSGISNLVAYALGLNPFAATTADLPAASSVVNAGANYLSISFGRNALATDLTYTVQGSNDLSSPGNWTDLASWSSGSWSPASLVQETGVSPNIRVQVRDTVPLSLASRRFLRLKVSH